jgi:hypothetical protein
MRLQALLLGVVLLSLFVATNAGQQRSASQRTTPRPDATAECKVTEPNGIAAGVAEIVPSSYGNSEVSVGPFGLCPDGIVVFKPGGPGFVTRGGALGMKWGWMRGVSGELRITGRRLDGEAPPLRSEVPSGYGERGFQVSYLIFPTPGCWEVTGSVGQSSVTFVTKVVKIGKGPSWRRRDLP